jgi:hypothetical protein
VLGNTIKSATIKSARTLLDHESETWLVRLATAPLAF